ncbi:hypothetical protein BRE01_67470 [Brevibacillus reuszeri]|uniref:Peptidase M10 metallopeptidase domain-containing protein n=1 Tax=Brevibacillus reuszeri TaxID=54915 RepID=A0A0K9YPU0_9BACL|nr:matrixin family metalloprotease [Brevibacillus reuszeri]KNB70195.1 hypothetical protein ADS79_14595 [Brevibacillus reuszeri]GED73045.1 hypothetical protein BRE01_67470 [Brevibacillus reuszeri]
MLRKRAKFATGLFTVVASLSFLTTSAFADHLGGKWDVYNVIYEDINLTSKYSRVLWSAADEWNAISEINLSPADDETGYIAVKHQPKTEDYNLGRTGLYGLGMPYDEMGRLNRGPYASADLIIVRYTCDPLDTTDTIKTITHEFGHTLGLAHTSDTSIDSIMDKSDVFKVRIEGPTRYDRNELRALYD